MHLTERNTEDRTVIRANKENNGSQKRTKIDRIYWHICSQQYEMMIQFKQTKEKRHYRKSKVPKVL